MWETIMAFALEQRKAEVKFINCSGLASCGVAPKRRGVREEGICSKCTQCASGFLDEQGLAHEFLALTPEVEAELNAWVTTLPVEALKTAHYKGSPVGEWIHPDMVSHHLQCDPDTSDPLVAEIYRDCLYGAAAVVEGLPGLIAAFAPDVAVLLSGSFFLHRAALEIFRSQGIRVITHERGLSDNTLIVNANAPIWHGEQITDVWEPWKSVPLNATELGTIDKLLRERRRGKNMGWTPFSPLLQAEARVLAALELPPDRPVALLCTTVDHEASLIGLETSVTQEVWLQDAVAWCTSRSDVTLVIRAHPAYAAMKDYDRIILPGLERQRSQLPSSVKMILPHEKISTYTLMDLASFCITYGSTVGLEMACAGLPVVHAGRAPYKDAGFTLEVKSREDYPLQLERALRQGRSTEVSRLAYRFAYHYFTGFSHPMNHGKVSKDYVNANLNLRDKAELAPGKDAHLDRLVSYILGEVDLLYTPPGTHRLSASTTDEDRFLAEQRLTWQIAAARAHPDEVELLYDVAVSLRELGRYQESASLFANVVERQPDHAEAQRALADLQERQAHSSQAA
jgi:hypothetical protein